MEGILPWDQEHGIAMAEAAEGAFMAMGHPSRLALGIVGVVASSAGIEDDPGYAVVLASISMGYACRLSHPRELPEPVAQSVDAALIRNSDGSIDFDGLEAAPDRFLRLMTITSDIAHDPDRLNRLSGCTIGSWQAFSVTAGYSIQSNSRAKGLKKRQMLSLDEIDDMLRIGYALRIIDEVAGLEPQHGDFSES